jgi:hypothetical protein
MPSARGLNVRPQPSHAAMATGGADASGGMPAAPPPAPRKKLVDCTGRSSAAVDGRAEEDEWAPEGPSLQLCEDEPKSSNGCDDKRGPPAETEVRRLPSSLDFRSASAPARPPDEPPGGKTPTHKHIHFQPASGFAKLTERCCTGVGAGANSLGEILRVLGEPGAHRLCTLSSSSHHTRGRGGLGTSER